MSLAYWQLLDRAAPLTPSSGAREATGRFRHRSVPAVGDSAAAVPRRASSAVARWLLPAHDAPTRDRRPLFPAVRECLEVSRTDRDLTSAVRSGSSHGSRTAVPSFRARHLTALDNVVASTRDVLAAQAHAAAHKAARSHAP